MATDNDDDAPAPTSDDLFVGVDVGTGSVRAVLVTVAGLILASSSQETTTFRSEDDHRIFEQSTTDIWSAICKCVTNVLLNIDPARVKGIGFDATCSLAVTDLHGNPLSVSHSEGLGTKGLRNIILWADHRAEHEAELINSSGSIVLDYVGGVMSLEMEIPKILWLKNNMPPSEFSKCQFFDLPDYLTYRATGGCTTRSACSLVCKCSYIPTRGDASPSGGWQDSFFEQIGLGEFVADGYQRLGPVKPNADGLSQAEIHTAGLPVGVGLSREAANQLGLREATPVGSAVIDAYAGWIGTVAARIPTDDVAPSLDESQHRLAAVAGTSTCHLVQSPNGVFVPGVWGPYKDAVFPGWWMNEGGQSSTGQLIDFMITTHPAYSQLVQRAESEKTSIHIVLANHLEKLRREAGVESLTQLTKDMHFYPDLHGNRSPIADPQMRGSIVGLALDRSLNDLARKFHLTLEGIALQTRHIVDSMNARGHSINSLYMSGGQARNQALMQLFADVCNMPVVLPASVPDAVSRGSAMLGRFAAEASASNMARQKCAEELGEALWDIMVEMTPPGTVVAPAASPKEKKLLEAKYKIFLESIEIQNRWRAEMGAACGGSLD